MARPHSARRAGAGGLARGERPCASRRSEGFGVLGGGDDEVNTGRATRGHRQQIRISSFGFPDSPLPTAFLEFYLTTALLPFYTLSALATLNCRAQADVSSAGSQRTFWKMRRRNRISSKAARARSKGRARRLHVEDARHGTLRVPCESVRGRLGLRRR